MTARASDVFIHFLIIEVTRNCFRLAPLLLFLYSQFCPELAKIAMNVKFLLLQAFSLYFFSSAAFCLACTGSSRTTEARKVTRLGKQTNAATIEHSNIRGGAIVGQHMPSQHKATTPLPKVKSLLSKLAFSWTSDLLRLGNTRPLEISDLWRMPEEQEMKQTACQLNSFLEEERKVALYEKNTKKNILQEYWASPVTRSLLRMYRKEFVRSGLVKFVNTVVQFLPSLIITRILKFTNQQKDAFTLAMGWEYIFRNQGIQLCVLLFLCLSTKTAIENQYFDMVTNVGAQIRGALSTAIYQKSLRLGAGSRQNVTVGEIVNYMQIDTTRLEYVAGTIHTVWDGLLQIFGYTSLLLYFLGPSVFAGIAAMLFILPLNAFFLAKLSALREENLVYTDSRVKLTNEVLQGIRAVKSYNWEGPFKQRLEEIRKKEMQLLVDAGKARAVLVSALFAAPSFVAVFSLAVYALLGNRLDPTKVFTSLALFNQLRFPLTFFPMLLNSLAEGKVSLDRLTKFFNAEEVAGYVETEYSEEDIKLAQTSQPLLLRNAIMIKNGTFAYTANSPATTATLAATAAEKASEDERSVSVDSVVDNNRTQEVRRGMLSGINLSIRKGELIAVLGPTGSGKSTLLQALLGELYKVSGRVVVKGKVAYVPQASWIPNDSLRNVVLFGKEMDEEKYREALRVAGLTKDLDLLEAGDLTEIGERGVNLSGGQKQRVSIARAVYEDADVVLLDDPLSALDSEVGAKVFRDCFKTALRGKTRVLVTHQLSVLSEVDRIVLMDVDEVDGASRIVDQGSLRQLVARGYDLSKYISPTANSEEEEAKQEASTLVSDEAVVFSVQSDASAIPDATSTIDQVEGSTDSASLLVGNVPPSGAMMDCTSSDCVAEEVVAAEVASISATATHDSFVQATQLPEEPSKNEGDSSRVPNMEQESVASPQRTKALMTKEERAEGAVSAKVYRSYLSEAKKPLLFALMMISFLLANASTILQQWVVAAWTGDASYKLRSLRTYLAAVAGMASSVAGFTYFRTYLQCRLGAAVSESLHNKMTKKVLNAPLNYFESTPIGRLIQRFSKDLDQVDQQLPSSMGQLLASVLQISANMAAICVVTPSFSIVMGIVTSIYMYIINYYRPISRDMKRLDSLSRSPIYSHFSETLGGLSVLRSFRREDMYKTTNAARIDDNMSAYFALKAVDRWLCVRLESLGNLVVLFASVLAVLSGSRAGTAGLSLNNALGITTLLNWAVRNAAETESLMNSVERVYYIVDETPQEKTSVLKEDAECHGMDAAIKQSGWPQYGALSFSRMSMRYREDFDPVLRDVNLFIRPGERVGIVGRTGSGKSSLFRALLRLSELEEGDIVIDGVNLKDVSLSTLRSSISIIPQDPVLFTGTVRSNLDPFHQFEDSILWDALRKSNLANVVLRLPGRLDFEVTEGGENFSQGQRQLLCLARALVRKSKVLLLDEATSSVDFDTDAFIQRTIRQEFSGKGATVLTIAHRLRTIMDADRILVMDAGRVKEFDSPAALLRNPRSLFSSLVAAERQQEESKVSEADDDLPESEASTAGAFAPLAEVQSFSVPLSPDGMSPEVRGDVELDITTRSSVGQQSSTVETLQADK